jgi:hypothetical protein
MNAPALIRKEGWPVMGIIVVGFFLIGIMVLVLFDGLLHRAMKEPLEQHPVSSMPDTDEAEGAVGNDVRDRL